jgi:hypothetical protein
MIALFFAAGTAGWLYTVLVRSNGNAVPAQNYAGASIGGVVVFVLIFTLMKYVLGI